MRRRLGDSSTAATLRSTGTGRDRRRAGSTSGGVGCYFRVREHEAGIGGISCGGENDAQYLTLRVDQWATGVAATNQGTDRVHLPLHGLGAVDVLADDAVAAADARRLGVEAAVLRVAENHCVRVGNRRLGRERDRRRRKTRYEKHGHTSTRVE